MALYPPKGTPPARKSLAQSLTFKPTKPPTRKSIAKLLVYGPKKPPAKGMLSQQINNSRRG